MKKAMILILVMSVVLSVFSSCHAQQTKHQAVLTKQIVEQTIKKNYSPQNLGKWFEIKYEFHSIKIGKSGTAGKLKIGHFSDATILHPVLVKYTETLINKHDNPYPWKYQVDDLTREYVFYLDQWGNWEVKQVLKGENIDVKSHHD